LVLWHNYNSFFSGVQKISTQYLFNWHELCSTDLTLFFINKEVTKNEPINWISSSYWTSLYITEINPQDNIFPEYIEISSQNWYYGHTSFVWLGHGSANKDIFISLQANERLIISDKDMFHENVSKIILDSISLTDNWEEIIVYGQSWHVMDKTFYSPTKTNKSFYYSVFSWDIRLFDDEWILTPWFSYDQIAYLFEEKENEEFSCAIEIQNKKEFVYGNKINLISFVWGKWIQNSSKKYRCERKTDNESLDVDVCNPWFFSYEEIWLHKVYKKTLLRNDLQLLPLDHLFLKNRKRKHLLLDYKFRPFYLIPLEKIVNKNKQYL